jgi:hypothetical protein
MKKVSTLSVDARTFFRSVPPKSVRDRLENLPVTDINYGLSWFSTILSIILLTIGLWNAQLLPREKGFYAFAFLLALFAAIAVQKNTGDVQAAERSRVTPGAPPSPVRLSRWQLHNFLN